MYIRTKYSGYNRHGEQSSGGMFLILMQSNVIGDQSMRAVVRYVRLRQIGHFMMGSAQVGKVRLVLSGAYGGDGLPKTVDDATYQRGVPVPAELIEAWSNGGGWNSAGSEAGPFREWALNNLRALRGK
jgi:hypothetical protein